ncbi:hypothetical protein [Wenjunlia tyrosinilytica]|uniref:Uncharacterized protein n=1 Tax=Wenjunlia tyrosinilytica TaxID=1544741 RepID=A0A917ZXV2_9ACTN|nr:hypothetical protein [Wenjunlia tyrosinilytica]GGP00131.1 hypothetical protein GCM10012280_68190 [Wenjunlia tyrosinilytica]
MSLTLREAPQAVATRAAPQVPREEWRRLRDGLRSAWAAGGLRGMPLAWSCVALILLFSVVQHTAAGGWAVERLGVVRAALPLEKALLRTPVSLFVPALDLPAWGAMAQVLVVFGLAELTLGRTRTIMVALAATAAGTTYARIAIRLGPEAPGGLPWHDTFTRDTGPSAAVVALAVFIAWRWRSRLLVVAITGAMIVEVALKPNLAGWEHLAATAVGALLAAFDQPLTARWNRTLALATAAAQVGRPAVTPATSPSTGRPV